MDSEIPAVEGFLVHSWYAAGQFRAAGRLVDGQSFAVVLHAVTSCWVVAAADQGKAQACLDRLRVAYRRRPLESFAGQPLVGLECSAGTRQRVADAFQAAGIPLQADRPRPAADVLLERGIRGSLRLTGQRQAGKQVDWVFVDPVLTPATVVPPLQWLALDIETARDGTVRCVALVQADHSQVFFLGSDGDAPEVECFSTEAGLLTAVAATIRAWDPDVLTGWNVLDFDLAHLEKRFALHQLPFWLGRTPEPAVMRLKPGSRASAFIPGRQAVDAMRIARGSGTRFEDQTLDTVAEAVLGTTKTVRLRGEAKLAELDRLYAQAPLDFCHYCRQDAALVLAILEKTGLGELTVRRAALTGVELDLAWTSIPTFERIYALELHRRGIVPPLAQSRPVSGAAGGMVLEPQAGLFSEVQVFDFRSLYPSIMRTFGIDPLGHERAGAGALIAPNGAAFARQAGILPALIAEYFDARQAAQRQGDATASYVYKILMNSFYGVLGAGGCRYGRTELAGAITTFGRQYLEFARQWFETRGYSVLYGDTDSVFVRTEADGEALAQAVTADLAASIAATYQVESFLQLRFEKRYRAFLIPRMRGEPGGQGRGRAKGYAGWLEQADGSWAVEIKGMEAVRSDWTPLARRFQTELLEQIFRGDSAGQLSAYRAGLVRQLQRGELDPELIYRKILRRPAQDYLASAPPQVRAARMLGWTHQRGSISYWMTVQGPRPVELPAVGLDYAHYIEHQLAPIWRSLLDAAGWSDNQDWGDQLALDF